MAYNPWHKGKELPEELRKKISEKLKGRVPWNKGLTTGIGGNKGKKFSEEHKEKIRIALEKYHENLRREKTSRT